MTIEDGYAIQRAWLQLKLAEGRVVKGRKIGLTSRAMQQASQITEPDYAPLLDDMFFEAGGDIPVDRFIAPRVEVELAFVLGRPLQGPGRDALRRAARRPSYVTPAVEIIDARIEQFDRETKAPRKVFDTIADFAANAGIVIGGRPVRPHDVDLRWVGALLYKNGVIEETGLAAAVLNHPGNGVAWLANKIAPYDEQLERRRRRPRRLVHPADDGGARRRLPCRLRAARRDRLPLRLSLAIPQPENPMKQQKNAFKAALARREAQIGLWLSLADAYVAEMVATTGFDWLLIDAEHAPNDLRTVLAQLQAVAPYPVQPGGAAGAGRQGADQAVPRHRRAEPAGADGPRREAGGRGGGGDALRAARARAASAARCRGSRAGARSRTTSPRRTTRSASWCRRSRRRRWRTWRRSPRSTASTACSSARPTSRPRWATSASRAIPRC